MPNGINVFVTYGILLAYALIIMWAPCDLVILKNLQFFFLSNCVQDWIGNLHIIL